MKKTLAFLSLVCSTQGFSSSKALAEHVQKKQTIGPIENFVFKDQVEFPNHLKTYLEISNFFRSFVGDMRNEVFYPKKHTLFAEKYWKAFQTLWDLKRDCFYINNKNISREFQISLLRYKQKQNNSDFLLSNKLSMNAFDSNFRSKIKKYLRYFEILTDLKKEQEEAIELDLIVDGKAQLCKINVLPKSVGIPVSMVSIWENRQTNDFSNPMRRFRKALMFERSSLGKECKIHFICLNSLFGTFDSVKEEDFCFVKSALDYFKGLIFQDIEKYHMTNYSALEDIIRIWETFKVFSESEMPKAKEKLGQTLQMINEWLNFISTADQSITNTNNWKRFLEEKDPVQEGEVKNS